MLVLHTIQENTFVALKVIQEIKNKMLKVSLFNILSSLEGREICCPFLNHPLGWGE